MGLFSKRREARKLARMSKEEQWEYWLSKSIAPEFDYCPEELLRKFLMNAGLKLEKHGDEYSFARDKIVGVLMSFCGVKMTKGETVIDVPIDTFRTTEEMKRVLMPVFDKAIKEPLLDVYTDKTIGYWEFVGDYKIEYGQTSPIMQKLYETDECYPMSDLILNKFDQNSLDEFYRLFYDTEFYLDEELKKLEQGEIEYIDCFGFKGEIDEKIRIRLTEDENGERTAVPTCTLSYHHAYHRASGDKWKGSFIGEIEGVEFSEVFSVLKSLEDENAMLCNRLYQGGEGRYSVKELKKWVKENPPDKMVLDAISRLRERMEADLRKMRS